MAKSLRIINVEPTVFFARSGDTLRQLIHLTLKNNGNAIEASLQVRAGSVDEWLPLDIVQPGETRCEVYLPDIRSPIQVKLTLWADDALQDEKTVDWKPQKHWEIYLVHFSHHDIGYTDLPANLMVEHTEFMDQVLRYCEETSDWPEDSRFRYCAEQTWSVMPFVENRPREMVEHMAHFIKRGQIEVTALYGNQTQEICGHEEMIRLLYPAFQLKRELGIEITSAQHNDIPGYSWAIASVLAGAGVRYFFTAIPEWYFGGVHVPWDEDAFMAANCPGAHWWEGPDGKSVLHWHVPFDEGVWTPTSYLHALRELPGWLNKLEECGYTYDMILRALISGMRDNSPPTMRFAYIAREWNEHWAYPRLITANPTQFFERFEQRYGHTLKNMRGDLPGTDYPVTATCTPKETALNRNTHDALLTAEKLAAIASIAADYDYPKSDLDEAYRQVFNYDEHCWGMGDVGGPAQDGCWSEQSAFAYRAAALTHDVVVKASNKIVDQISLPDDCYTITVFNSLSWKRTDLVRASLRHWSPHGSPMHWVAPRSEDEGPTYVLGGAIGRGIMGLPGEIVEKPFELVEVGTGKRVPYQLVRTTDPQSAIPWAAERVAVGKLTEIVFLAEDLPSMGYKTYQVVPCKHWPKFDGGHTATDKVLENQFFRLELDTERGTIRSLLDKELGQELVDPDAPHGFGQMIIRDCGTAEEELTRLVETSLTQDGPAFSTITLKAEGSCCPRVTEEITLHNWVKRIDFNARVLRDSTPQVEVFFAFPFRVENPCFHFEAPNAVIEPISDQLPGSNTDYYAVQHWADVSNEEWGVVWTAVDTPMTEFGGMWPGYVSGAHHGVRGPGYGHPFLKPGDLKLGYIYSLVSYNNFGTNFINVHPCEYLVRYAFGTHKGNWRSGGVRQFGWSVANPPQTVWMKGSKNDGSLPPSTSFCEIDAPNVMALTFKKAEDGNGHILRLIETEGKETTTTVKMPYLTIRQMFETNLAEENQRISPCGRHSMVVTVRPFAITTLRLADDL
jgi:hypothetical protein